MNAEQWAEKSRAATVASAVELLLPSGMVIKARRPGPGMLASWGHVPGRLAALVAGGGAGSEESRADAVEFAVFFREALAYCVVEPEISLTPGPGQIHPRRIADADLHYIIAWAIRGPEAISLESFRAKRRDAGHHSDSAGIPTAAVSPARDRRSGAGARAGSGGRRSSRTAKKTRG